MTPAPIHARAALPFRLAVLIGVCLFLLWLTPVAALASYQPPPNDNFLDSVNLNAPGRPLPTVDTLSSSINTAAATLQPNVLDPCGESVCANGPREQSTCDGVGYGKTVWYDFYPDHDGQVEIRTNGIPNIITLYTYNPRSLAPTEVECATGSNYKQNELFENVQRGVDYTVQVGGRGSVGGLLKVKFNYVDSTHLTVAPFLTSALRVPEKGDRARLLNLKFIGVAAGETISAACAFCAHGDLRQGVQHGNMEQLNQGSKPTISSRSRIIIAATAPAQIGRFKVYSYRPHLSSLPVLAQGCLAPGVTFVTAIDAEHLAALKRIPCPVRLVNPIGGEYVFWRSIDAHLEEKWYSGSRWSPTIRLQIGGLASAPSVAVHVKGEQDVFWKGVHGQLQEAWYNGAWHGPMDVGAGGLASAPSAGADGSGKEYVFWQGTDGGLFGMWYAAGRWTRPFEVRGAGLIGSAPVVAVHSDGQQDVFWKGTNGDLWEISTPRANGGWSSPQDLGGGELGSAPSAGADAAGNDYVVWRGTDHRLWGKSQISGGWDPAAPLNGGVLASRPTIAVQADGEQDVFWRGLDDRLWETWYEQRRWHGPVHHNAHLPSPPSAGVDAAGKQATEAAQAQPH